MSKSDDDVLGTDPFSKKKKAASFKIRIPPEDLVITPPDEPKVSGKDTIAKKKAQKRSTKVIQPEGKLDDTKTILSDRDVDAMLSELRELQSRGSSTTDEQTEMPAEVADTIDQRIEERTNSELAQSDDKKEMDKSREGFWDELTRLLTPFKLDLKPKTLIKLMRLILLEVYRYTQQVYIRSRGDYRTDRFGYDPMIFKWWQPFFDFMFTVYFRCQVIGVENIPKDDRVMFLANHAGIIPWDGAMIKMALLKNGYDADNLRILVSPVYFKLPFLSTYLSRTGQVLSCYHNTKRVLEDQMTVIAFPEGYEGSKKSYKKRYTVQAFKDYYLFNLALEKRIGIVPTAVIGSEETYPILSSLTLPGRLLGLPFLPVVPSFILLPTPIAFVPLPSKWTISFRKVVMPPDEADISNSELGHASDLSQIIRQAIQEELLLLLKKRRSVFKG